MYSSGVLNDDMLFYILYCWILKDLITCIIAEFDAEMGNHHLRILINGKYQGESWVGVGKYSKQQGGQHFQRCVNACLCRGGQRRFW